MTTQDDLAIEDMAAKRHEAQDEETGPTTVPVPVDTGTDDKVKEGNSATDKDYVTVTKTAVYIGTAIFIFLLVVLLALIIALGVVASQKGTSPTSSSDSKTLSSLTPTIIATSRSPTGFAVTHSPTVTLAPTSGSVAIPTTTVVFFSDYGFSNGVCDSSVLVKKTLYWVAGICATYTNPMSSFKNSQLVLCDGDSVLDYGFQADSCGGDGDLQANLSRCETASSPTIPTQGFSCEPVPTSSLRRLNIGSSCEPNSPLFTDAIYFSMPIMINGCFPVGISLTRSTTAPPSSSPERYYQALPHDGTNVTYSEFVSSSCSQASKVFSLEVVLDRCTPLTFQIPDQPYAQGVSISEFS